MLASMKRGRIAGALVALLAAAAAGACGSSAHFASAGSGGSAGTAGAGGGPTGGAGGSAGSAGGSAGGAAGAAGNAGAGGATQPDAGPDAGCTDADKDGVTTCQGDCDDNDPNTYPGAPEICGDGKNNGCTGGPPDQGCGGLGTFVSAKVGTSGGKGTTTDPVDTIAHGMQNASKILKSNSSMKQIGVYVADGHYPEKVVLAEGISLYGGFSCETTTNCTWKHDPKSFDTAILDQDDEGLLVPQNITRQTRLDGFRIQGHDTDQPQYLPGAVALTIAGGSPTISDNTINGPAISGSGSTSTSIGIAVAGSNGAPIQKPGPLIISNTINGGQAANGSAGISLGAPRNFNTSSGSPPGTVAQIKLNHISGGNAQNSYGITAGTSTDGTAAVSNIIAGGQATNESWGIAIGGVLLADSNVINADKTQVPTCAKTSTKWCGGIVSWSGDATLENNIVYGADGLKSTAVRLTQTEKQVQEVVVNSNYLVGAPPVGASVVPPTDAVIVLENPGCSNCQAATVGRIRNNFIMPGRAKLRYGILEAPSTQDIHPEKIENNDFWFIPYSLGATDVIYEERTGGVPKDRGLVEMNALPIAAGNFSADCYDTTFHLKSGSRCIDAGLSSDAPDHDFEGDKRPQGNGFDVGPDEAK